MAGGEPRAGRRRWWAIGLALSAAAVLIRAAALANSFDNVSEGWIVVGLGVGITALLMWLTLVVYHRSEFRLRENAGSSSWVHRCVDPDEPQAWLSVVVSDEAVTVVGRKNRVRRRWQMDNILDVRIAPVRIGLLDHTGLILTLREGAPGYFALPSRSTLSYPKAVADQAEEEIRRRLTDTRA